MNEKKNNILAFGNKDFNNSLDELKNHFKFNLEIKNDIEDFESIRNYQGLIIHEDFKHVKIANIVKDIENVIVLHQKIIILKYFEEKEKIKLQQLLIKQIKFF